MLSMPTSARGAGNSSSSQTGMRQRKMLKGEYAGDELAKCSACGRHYVKEYLKCPYCGAEPKKA
ncbi:MAG: hypothetical protein ABC595_00155 [Candidatus Methanosuratincola petrocarbonis]